MAYTSSLITYGRGIGVVTATGMNTEVGHIASLLNNNDEFDTPLKRKLSAVGKTLSIVGLIVCVIIFVIGLLYKRPILPLFMTAISLYNTRRLTCNCHDSYGSWSKTYGKRKCLN